MPSAFVATDASTSATVVSSGAWYPVIDLADLRKVQNLGGTVTDERLTESVALAMAAVEDQLDAWQLQQVALGRASMSEVPAKMLDGTSRLVRLYRRAVYATVAAEFIERYRQLDTTDSGQRRAEQMDISVDDHHRYVRYAIRDILGRPRATAELL